MSLIQIIKDLLIFLLLSIPDSERTDTSVSNEVLLNLSKVNNDFGINLFGLLSEQNNNNDIISPISLFSALSMLYNGAKGQTANELNNLLGLRKNKISEEELNEGFNSLLNQIVSETNRLNNSYELNIANRVIIQNDFRILKSFWNNLKLYFKADIQSVDFTKDGENAVNEINQWIKTKTNNKIEKLFDEPLDQTTKLVIVNAVYFKGDWINPFSEHSTYEREFFNDGITQTQVQMMSEEQEMYNYTTNVELDSDLLELPYKGNDLSLVIVLPRERNGLQKLKSIINEENLNLGIKSLKPLRLDLYLPKFKIEQKYDIKSALVENFALNVFTSEADLSLINGQKDLRVSNIVHKVVIEVNERGSEAAAATGIKIVPQSAIMNPKEFRADHPFLYLIRDKRNGIILFIGQINRL